MSRYRVITDSSRFGNYLMYQVQKECITWFGNHRWVNVEAFSSLENALEGVNKLKKVEEEAGKVVWSE